MAASRWRTDHRPEEGGETTEELCWRFPPAQAGLKTRLYIGISRRRAVSLHRIYNYCSQLPKLDDWHGRSAKIGHDGAIQKLVLQA